MKVKTIPSTWLVRKGHRFDSKPFISGALEARMILENLAVKKVPLGGLAEIYHAGRESRAWVNDPKYGTPFLGGSSILAADLSNLPLISNKKIVQNPRFIIHEGWTLITRSGTVGRMAYVRPEMDGMACSEHVMRVVPDPGKIPPGYLYAYLSGKFGVPQVVSGTYGAIIQHIEPEHIKDLPVPRLGKEVEERANNLIKSAAKLRCSGSVRNANILKHIHGLLGWDFHPHRKINTVVSSAFLGRFDAFHYSDSIIKARECLADHSGSKTLGTIVPEVFEPNRGARLKAGNGLYGVPFLSSSSVFMLDPQGEYLISKQTPHFDRFLVTEHDILLPRSGQLGGIIGRAVLPLPSYYGSAASEHLIRIRCRSREDACYLWAVFASQPGYLSSIGTAYGTSIPSLDAKLLPQLKVPWLIKDIREKIVKEVSAKAAELTEAVYEERRAVELVENFISENTSFRDELP